MGFFSSRKAKENRADEVKAAHTNSVVVDIKLQWFFLI
jgi:hypothetical protein